MGDVVTKFWNGYRWSDHHEPGPDTRSWGPSPLTPIMHGLRRIAKVNELVNDTRAVSASPTIEFEPAGAPSRCKHDDPYLSHPAVYECVKCDAQCCISCDVRLHEPGDPARRAEVKTIAKSCPRCRGLEVAAGTPFDPKTMEMRTGGVVVRYPNAMSYVDVLNDEEP